MTDLIAKLQGLSGPSREVDAGIFQLLGGSEWDEAYMHAQEPCGCPHDMAVSITRERYSPRYTASLDAAVALCERVLPGYGWTVDKSGGRGFAGVGQSFNEEAATPAIALLIAILTALEARDGKD